MRKTVEIKNYVKYPTREEAFVVSGDGAPFQLAFAGITHPYPDYCISRDAESNSICVLEYVTSGAGEVVIDGVCHRVRAGDTYLLRPGEAHLYRADRGNPWEKLWINYNSSYLPAMLDAYGIQSGIYRAPTYSFFITALEAAKSNRPHAEKCRVLADCVHGIVSAVYAGESAQFAPTDAQRIRDALSAALYSRLSLDTLATELHISKSNLIRIFKEAYGVTPYEYLLGAKIEAASALLVNTRMSVGEIADHLAIHDAHYFSTLFYKRTGMRPLEYRRHSGKSNA